MDQSGVQTPICNLKLLNSPSEFYQVIKSEKHLFSIKVEKDVSVPQETPSHNLMIKAIS